jgi:hypothetical protein
MEKDLIGALIHSSIETNGIAVILERLSMANFLNEINPDQESYYYKVFDFTVQEYYYIGENEVKPLENQT